MRRPKLRKKKVKGHEYWYTAVGSAYFGTVGEVSYEDTRRHFAEHIKYNNTVAPAVTEFLTPINTPNFPENDCPFSRSDE